MARNVLVFWVVVLACSCANRQEERNTVDSGKAVKELEAVEYTDNEEFAVDTTFTADKYYCVSILHKVFAHTEYYRLFSPEGRLLLSVAGASESCAVDGYVVKYEDGRIASIGCTGSLEDEAYRKLGAGGNNAVILKKWYDELVREKLNYTFSYNDKGLLQGIDEIDVPAFIQPGNIEYCIYECPAFWASDLDGGRLCFFVLFKDIDPESSSESYLYADGKLAAELAYWKGTFIKARTYNIYGQMVDVYDDRNMDIKAQVIEDRWTQYKWYVDRRNE